MARLRNHCWCGKTISVNILSVCSLSHPASNAPYCHLWPVRVLLYFPNHLISGTTFENGYWTWNVCFDFICNFCLKSLRGTYGGTNINCVGLQQSIFYFCHILKKFLFSGLMVGKYSNIIFHGKPSAGSRVVPCVRMDGQTWRS